MKKILIVIFFINLHSFSQWSFNSGKNDFDGNYKVSTLYGSGGSFPYTKPLLVINKYEKNQVNIYLTNVGYSGCENRLVYFKFNNEETVYETDYVNSGLKNDSWFLYFKDLKNYQFLAKIVEKNSLSVRVQSDCGSEDYRFNLSGSSKAINYVLGNDWIENERKNHLNQISLERKKDSLTNIQIHKFFKETKLRDSITGIKKIQQEEKKKIERDSIKNIRLLKINNDYRLKYSDLNYMFCEPINEVTRFYQFMQDIKPKLNLKRDVIIIISRDFVNKVFYKVEYIEGEGKTTYYVLKKEVREIK
ncbi:hypothetical protein [Polaribacter sp.]|uniref:hypothetical protein n=1 Tax=Polaribacter sp. TaxID=1920175 RepID=UPI0040487EEA